MNFSASAAVVVSAWRHCTSTTHNARTRRDGWLAVGVCAVVALAGCGGGSSVTVSGPGGKNKGPVISGQVSMPNGQVATAPSTFERLAQALAARVEALVAGNVEPVGGGVAVTLLEISDGNVVNGQIQGGRVAFQATTDSHGSYAVQLPTGTDVNTCRFVLEVGSAAAHTLTRAFVDATQVNIDFQSEAAVRLILEQINAQATTLCSLDANALASITAAVRASPSPVVGGNVAAVNNAAADAAAADAGVQNAIAIAIGAPTPVPSETETAPPTPTPASTATATVAAATATAVPTTATEPVATHTSPPLRTATNTPAASAAPSRTATATVTNTIASPTTTATSAPTHTATQAATSTAPHTATVTALPTGTAAATDTAVPTHSATPVATATASPTVTVNAPPTGTAPATNTAVQIATNTALPTSTHTPVLTPTAVPTTATTNTVPPTPTNTGPPTSTGVASSTPTASAAASTSTPVATATATSLATDTAAALPTDTPTQAPTATATPVAATPTVAPTCPLMAGEYLQTTTSGSLHVATFAPFPFPAGGKTTQELSAGDANCVHTIVVPFPGGLTVPVFCVPALGASTSVTQSGCGIGEIDSNGGSDFTIVEHGDTSETTICNAHQATCPGAGPAPDSSGRLDITVGDGTPDTCASGTANAIVTIPVSTLTWVAADSSCPDTDGTYDAGTDSLLAQFPQTLDLTTDKNTAQFVDIDGDGCAKSGLGPLGPYSNTGKCIDLVAQTVSVAASGTIFSSGGPTFDLLFTTVQNATLSGPTPSNPATCSMPPVINFGGLAHRCLAGP